MEAESATKTENPPEIFLKFVKIFSIFFQKWTHLLNKDRNSGKEHIPPANFIELVVLAKVAHQVAQKSKKYHRNDKMNYDWMDSVGIG